MLLDLGRAVDDVDVVGQQREELSDLLGRVLQVIVEGDDPVVPGGPDPAQEGVVLTEVATHAKASNRRIEPLTAARWRPRTHRRRSPRQTRSRTDRRGPGAPPTGDGGVLAGSRPSDRQGRRWRAQWAAWGVPRRPRRSPPSAPSRRSSARLADVQGLLAHQPPGRAERQVGSDQARVGRQPALRRVGQEAGDRARTSQARQLGSLEEAALGQGDAMVDEVPVVRTDEPDVRLQHDRPGRRAGAAATRRATARSTASPDSRCSR